MLISEGKKWKWRINLVQVRERQRSASGSAYSAGSDPKWRSRAHTYSNSSVTMVPPPQAFVVPPSSFKPSAPLHASTHNMSKPINLSTPPRTRPLQPHPRGAASPPPSSFNYQHLNSSSPNHHSTPRSQYTQSQTLTYAMNGYRA